MKKEVDTILIKTVSRLLPVELTDAELREAGDELAATVQEINSEDNRQKEIKDQLKARMSELEAKQSKLAMKITQKKEYRDIQVRIEMHTSGQVSETRIDTGKVLTLRDPYEEEKQFPLKPIEPKGGDELV